MEDPDSESEGIIQEYSSEVNSGKMSWVLNKGLSVGKKILVSGFVISSAPLVLPPLVLFSVVGFALSVPYGFFLATYACTNKLMSKLLPGTKAPYLLEYGTLSNGEAFAKYYEGERENLWIKRDIDMEKEEGKALEETIEKVEMRFELVEKENDEIDEGKVSVGDEHGQGGVRKDVEELVEDENEIVEENGYQADVGEYGDEKEEEPAKEIEVKEKEAVIKESWDIESPVDEVQTIVVDIDGDERSGTTVEEADTPFEMTNIAVGLRQNTDIEEDEELVRETRGLLERVREEGGDYVKKEESVKDIVAKFEGVREDEDKEREPVIKESWDELPVDEVHAVVVDIEGDEISGITVEEEGTPFEATSIAVRLCQNTVIEEDEELVRETRGLLERIREEGGDYVDEKGEESVKDIAVKFEGVGEEEDKEREPVIKESLDEFPVDEVHAVVVDIEGDEISGITVEEAGTPFEATSVAVRLCQNTVIEEDEELVSETRGLLEKIREEGMNDVAREEKQSVGNISAGAERNQNIEDISYHGDIITEKPTSESENRIKENNNDDIPNDSREMQDTYMENVDIIPKEMEPKQVVEGLSRKKDPDNVFEAEKPIGEMSGATNVCSTIEEEQKPVVDKHSMLHGERENDNIANDVEQNLQLNRKKEISISSNSDAREVADESGLDLFDDKNAAAQRCSYADFDPAEATENKKSSSYTSSETADFTTLPVFSGEHECNGTGVSSQKDIDMPSIEALYNEEKIWKQIEAMRMIVGYKAAPNATCLEELKALYLFTGVEPPASFKDPSDIIEVINKLRFLMAIVGVK